MMNLLETIIVSGIEWVIAFLIYHFAIWRKQLRDLKQYRDEAQFILDSAIELRIEIQQINEETREMLENG